MTSPTNNSRLNPDSTIDVPTGPGLGVTVDRRALAAVHARQPGDQGVADSMSQSEYYDVHRVFLRSFTVRDIAEPLLSFDATTPAADAVAAMTARGFQVAGLRRDGSVKGYVDREESRGGGLWRLRPGF